MVLGQGTVKTFQKPGKSSNIVVESKKSRLIHLLLLFSFQVEVKITNKNTIKIPITMLTVKLDILRLQKTFSS